MQLQFPSPYPDPLFMSYMAVMYPFHSYIMLPAVVAASANIARVSMLAPICASTAWNIAMLDFLVGNPSEAPKAPKPA